jgi:rhamnosyltransferase
MTKPITVAAITVLYHPPSETLENIYSYLEEVDILYVVDNSAGYSEHIIQTLKNHPHVHILSFEYNMGLSKTYNIVLRKLVQKNYRWAILFDQDTAFKQGDAKRFLQHFISCKTSKTIIFSANHNPKVQHTKQCQEVPFTLSSSSIVNIPAALTIGGFDEDLFIDEVDHEFCFRAKLHGYTILQDTHITLKHTLGTAHSSFKQIKCYPPVRLYYMVRNYLFIRSKYKIFEPVFFRQRDNYMILFILKHLFFCKAKLKTMLMIYLGIRDYRKKRFGAFHEK